MVGFPRRTKPADAGLRDQILSSALKILKDSKQPKLLVFLHTGSSTMNTKTRVALCLLFAAALLACSATATVSTTVKGDNVAALSTVLPVVNLGRKLASDGGSKAGPPPVKCTYAKGPKGINKVCN